MMPIGAWIGGGGGNHSAQARQTRQNSVGLHRASQDLTKGGGGLQYLFFYAIEISLFRVSTLDD